MKYTKLLSIGERAMYYGVPLLESFDATMLYSALFYSSERFLRWFTWRSIRSDAKRSRDERDIEPRCGGASDRPRILQRNANLWTLVPSFRRLHRASESREISVPINSRSCWNPIIEREAFPPISSRLFVPAQWTVVPTAETSAANGARNDSRHCLSARVTRREW